MKRYLFCLLALAMPTDAVAGKYMMGPVPSQGWDWVGDAVQSGIDIGLQGSVMGRASSRGATSAVEVGFHMGLFRPTHSWFASPALETSVSVLYDVDDDRWQVRTAVGTSVGPVILALGLIEERQDDIDGTALSTEVRIRHRFVRLKTPSVGAFVRADVFATQRQTYPDTVSLGVSGTLDIF